MTFEEARFALESERVGEWNAWKEDRDGDLRHVREAIDLSGATLHERNLTGANLKQVRLAGAQFEQAVLTRADLEISDMDGACLAYAVLVDASLGGASLVDADLRWANLRGADLGGASMRGARLKCADLTNANLRRARHVRLDECTVSGTVLSAHARDPWSVLRRTYTGTRFALSLLLLIAFLVPYVARTVFWTGVNRAQSALEGRRGVLAERAASLKGAPLETAVDDLLSVGPCLRRECRETTVAAVVLGFDKGGGYLVLALALIVYNLARGLLTFQVGPLREEEERVGITPAWWRDVSEERLERGRWWHRPGLFVHQITTSYGWLWRVHQGMRVLLAVAVASFVWNVWHWLSAPVWLPA